MELSLYVIIWYFFLKKTKDWKLAPLYSILIHVYFVGMIISFLLFNYTNIYRQDTSNIISCGAILYHLFYLILFFIPIKQIETRTESTTIQIIPYGTLKPFIFIMIVLSIISIISSIMIIDSLQSLSIDEIRTDVMIGGAGREMKASGSIMSHVSAFASEYSYIVLLLAFYCIAYYPTHKTTIYLLLASSFSYLFYNLEIGGREAIIRYVFDYAFVYIIFKKYLNNEWSNKIKKVLLTFGLVGIVIMASISFARFFVTQDTDSLISGTVGYFSQGFVYFSKFFEYFVDSDTYKGTIFYAFFHGDKLSMFELIDAPFPTNSFSTFVGSMVMSMGHLKALVPLIVFVIASKIISKMKPDTIFYYIYMFWIMRFAFSGIFYMIDSFRTGAKIYYFLLIFMLHFLYSQRKTIRWK